MTVVSIKGEPVVSHGEPNLKLIEMLESVLDGARSGRYTCGAIALVAGDGAVEQQWRGGGQGLLLAASIAVLNHDFIAGMK